VLFDGKTWFVKSARTRGSFSLMDIHGQVCPKVPNFRKLVRVQAATSRTMTWGSVGENVGIS
jgi:hypothetical protein